MATQRHNPNGGVIKRVDAQALGQFQLSPELRNKRVQQDEGGLKKKKPSASPRNMAASGQARAKSSNDQMPEVKVSLSQYRSVMIFSVLIMILSIAVALFHHKEANPIFDFAIYILLGVIALSTAFGSYFMQRDLIKALYRKRHDIKRLEQDIEKKIMHTNHHDRQLKHLIESTNVCPWNADLTQNCFTYIGPQIVSISGIDNGDWVGKGFLLEHVVPEDRKVWLNALRNLRSGSFVTLEYRIRSQEGKLIWLRNSFCLLNSNDKTKRLVQGFITDITEQKNVEVALKTARYAAEKASQTKSNFLASMSHELRTPLNSIIGFSEIMRSEAFGALGQPQYKEYSENIHSSGKHLLDLINDILDFSKIEAGKFDVIKEPVDLRDIFRSCEMLLRERAQRSELSLLMLAPENELMIEGDPKRLKQVFINLLSNSIKFTKPGGSVTLKYDVTDDNHLVMSVIDTGIGIKPEDLSTVFEKFHQVDAERNRDQEGTGLGLSISKSLAEMHDGVFNIQSVYGHGTTITVTFPPAMILEPTHQEEDVQEQLNILKGDDDDDDDDFFNRLQSM